MNTDKNYTILFSPIGSTDPISTFRDGSMLHIARLYDPNLIILFLSHEMTECERLDHRYTEAIKLLDLEKGRTTEIELIERPELKEVQLFDDFYLEFEEILRGIERRFPSAKIIVNISSGTPAMKSSLQTLAALGTVKRLVPVQVNTPNKSSNSSREMQKFNLEDAWECNLDNDPKERICRASKSSTLCLSAMIKTEMILKHIAVYDYNAARSIAEDITDFLPAKTQKLLNAAAARLLFDRGKVRSELGEAERDVIPILGPQRNMAEYLLWLEVKLERKEYADFIRGVTPLIADIFEEYLKTILRIDMAANYCTKTSNGALKLSQAMMLKTDAGRKILYELNNAYGSSNTEKYLCSDNMLVIIRSFSQDAKTIALFYKIRQVESVIRNMAAHEIVSITPEWIEKQTAAKASGGYTPRRILDMLFDAAEVCGISHDRIRDSYKKMNQLIKTSLNEKES